MTITEEQLYEAAPQTAEWLLATLPPQVDCDHEFSRRFEQKIRLLCQNSHHSPRINRFDYVAKRVAMLGLVAILSAFTVTMSVSALREQFFQVISSIQENGIEYYIRADDFDALQFHQISVGYVPAGFEMEWDELDERDLWSEYHVRYTHTDARTFFVSQRVEERYSGIFGDIEQETVTVQGDEAYLQAEGAYICLFWVHGPNIMTIIGDGMTRAEIFEIAENIKW